MARQSAHELSDRDFHQFQLTAGGWKLNAAVYGEGQQVLFLPGLGAAWQWWLSTMRTIGAGYKIYALDLPGTGLSGGFGVGRFPGPERISAAMLEAVDQLGIQEAIAVGHSLGGYLILQHLLQGGRGIKKGMVLSPGGVVPMRTAKGRMIVLNLIAPAPFLKGLYERLLLKFYDNWLPVDDEIRSLTHSDAARVSNRASLAYQLLRSTKLTLLADLPAIDKSVNLKERIHIIWGVQDSVFPVECAEHLAQFLGGAKYTLYENSDHWPQFSEKERFRTELREFLREP